MKSGRSSLIPSSVNSNLASKFPQNYNSNGSAVVLSKPKIPRAFIALSVASKPSDLARSSL